MFLTTPSPTRGIVLELHYLPSLEYMTAVLAHEPVYLDAQEAFRKQTWRNRCRILTAQGVDTLIVPVVEGRSGVPIREARIDYRQPWLNRHRRAIQTAYGKAPYFVHYGEAFERVFQKRPAFLFDLNLELLTICLQCLGVKKSIELTSSKFLIENEGITEARNLIHPKRTFRECSFYRPIAYRHVFDLPVAHGTEISDQSANREQFFPNLSILDLLFTQGPQARRILLQSAAG